MGEQAAGALGSLQRAMDGREEFERDLIQQAISRIEQRLPPDGPRSLQR
jgi:hypothetical protein